MIRRISILLLAIVATASAATLSPIQLLNPSGSTAGQAIVSTGASTAPGWATVVAGSLSPVAANTVIANVTGSTAAPSAFAMPSCSAAGNNLQYTSGTGFTCATGYAQLASPTFTGTVQTAALTATGAITPSQTAGIVGTTTNNNANAGAFGEYVSNSATGVAIASSTLTNVTSISLTAGDWDVSGVVNLTAAGTTTTTSVFAAVNTVSATLPGDGMYQAIVNQASAGFGVALLAPTRRISLSTTTTVFLITSVNYQVSTLTAGGTIRARRVR
ncbi:hypothetical protein ACKI2N_012315 [Cupriavidus sp. 30B13]|uniref:hypothetical protein n=1 Tax=Cupriavidus sp. 30B13 TaxID=3384241 RepID=UPI003B90D71B